jgi:hypothetical protein
MKWHSCGSACCQLTKNEKASVRADVAPDETETRHMQNSHTCQQDRHCMYKRNAQAHLRNHCCRGKEISIIYECVFVALVIHHAEYMRCIMLSSASSPILPHFSTLSHKQGKKCYI